MSDGHISRIGWCCCLECSSSIIISDVELALATAVTTIIVTNNNAAVDVSIATNTARRCRRFDDQNFIVGYVIQRVMRKNRIILLHSSSIPPVRHNKTSSSLLPLSMFP